MIAPSNALNFSGGPGALPESVLRQVQQAVIAVPEVGLSVLGISHRSDWFAAVVTEVEANIRSLLGLGTDYHVLLLQGGATQQFSMVPMTLLRGKAQAADYLHTGYWSGKSLPEARREGPISVVWSGEADGFRRLPGDDELSFSPDAPYLHYISNETVEGLQFHRIPGRNDVPRICDMSSDFLSRPCEAERFSLIYAHAQKNIGPAGVTVVVVKDRLLQDNPADSSITGRMFRPTRTSTRRRSSPSMSCCWSPAGCWPRLAGWKRWPGSIAPRRHCSMTRSMPAKDFIVAEQQWRTVR